MFDQNFNIANPSEEILSFLRANQSAYHSLRRRAVIYKADSGRWVLQACIVEGLSFKRETKAEESRRYSKAVLFEDWLSLEDLQVFMAQIQHGYFSLGEYKLESPISNSRWAREKLPLRNLYMPLAGYVWTTPFQDHQNSMHGELLVPKQPFYPNLHEAVKDWLALPIFQENGDFRKGEIILLLPETRAYFEDAIPQDNSIDLCIAGAEADNLSLEVTGAWWDDAGIHHFSECVASGRALLHVPAEAKRLDYVLVDSDGTVYDYQQETEFHHTGLGRSHKKRNESTLANIVRRACHAGEGPEIEFKPFIRPGNDKLYEVVKTVVAFANTSGGRIFLGINDGCELEGIHKSLAELTKGKVDEAACIRYLGEMRGKIRDELRNDVQMDFHQVSIDGCWIAVIEVSEAKEKPVTTRREEQSLYIRRGASNTKAYPEEWRAIIDSSRNGISASLMGNLLARAR